MQSILSAIWNQPHGFRCEEVAPKIYKFYFDQGYHIKKILRNQPWSYKNQMLVLKKWERGKDYTDYGFNMVPMWLQIWSVPGELRNTQVGNQILSYLGKVETVGLYSVRHPQGFIIKGKETINISLPLRRGHLDKSRDSLIAKEEDEQSPALKYGPWLRANQTDTLIQNQEQNFRSQAMSASSRLNQYSADVFTHLSSLSVSNPKAHKGDSQSKDLTKSDPPQHARSTTAVTTSSVPEPHGKHTKGGSETTLRKRPRAISIEDQLHYSKKARPYEAASMEYCIFLSGIKQDGKRFINLLRKYGFDDYFIVPSHDTMEDPHYHVWFGCFTDNPNCLGNSHWIAPVGGFEFREETVERDSRLFEKSLLFNCLVKEKFLCSFGGSILPRPLDGRLRYVGGETRIMTVSRNVSYEDLLARVRVLFDGVSVIKYQQPNEDVDSLVSVVNDDDVTNMIEEYDKLSTAGDGVVWLRIFLFSQIQDHDQVAATAHFDTDERENERRYIDALNNLTDAKLPSSPVFSEHCSRHPSMDGGNYNQLNLRHLSISNSSHGQRCGEMDYPCNPAFFSPIQHAASDPSEFSLSPPSSRVHLNAGEFSGRFVDDCFRQTPGYQLHPYDRQTLSPVENLVWVPAGAIVQEQSGFSSNLVHSQNMIESNNVCDHCHIAYHKNHGLTADTRGAIDNHLKHEQPYIEQQNMENEYVGNSPKSCAEYFCTRDSYMANQDMKMEHGIYVKEWNEHHHPFYYEYDQGRAHSHQITHRRDDMWIHVNGTGGLNEHHIFDGTIMNVPFTHGNADGKHVFPSNCISHDEINYIHHATNTGNEVYLPQQTVGGGRGTTGTYEPGLEDTAVVYKNQPSLYGAESLYQNPNNSHPNQSLWRTRHVPDHPGTSYEPSTSMMASGGDSFFNRCMQEGNPRLKYIHAQDEITNALSSQNNIMQQRVLNFQDSINLGSPYHYATRQNEVIPDQEYRIQHPPTMASYLTLPVTTAADRNLTVDVQRRKHDILKEPDEHIILPPRSCESFQFATDGLQLSEVERAKSKQIDADNNSAHGHGDTSGGKLNFLPELIASVKKAVLEGAEEVITTEPDVPSAPDKKESLHECVHEVHSISNIGHQKHCENEHVTAEETLARSLRISKGDNQASTEEDIEHEKLGKIEPTSAEAEALDKGLQMINNDDLEEIRQLGSGSFGSVYYGKWRGSDVAIKRIKASCFAGRPSERERLIADFWKEALIMSSLHHPNIVSFYGVVRDGPDGSLATVTEFMVNGSLKQFLQKKDRTIDRRKRLMIAMDVAFGMEYLHRKNIVHFDLKCENLLVNMRDPHRPICKIGDLGLSKVKQQTMVSGGLRGTLPWMAPELLSGKSSMVSDKIDVYSYGIVMWELLSGEEPYADMHCASIIGGIVNNSIRPKIPTWCDPEWKSLMESCWSSDPASRPSFSEISQKLRQMAAAIKLR
ncbi:hypothetical protein Cni_G02759 [Canna indica]|uniref:Protein kinase domain-containing protein n=1 Tax=Canna indica TaxID=4628 RepID=A0AAQ3Q2Z5_9LILI|nr:hypothetical protein Cni_G02759 [Canna indica]